MNQSEIKKLSEALPSNLAGKKAPAGVSSKDLLRALSLRRRIRKEA